jgi:nucleotide-binding universal stress UspA family protein
MTPPLIVGVDGSGASLAAVGWAGREAAATGRPLRLVYARPDVDSRYATAWARINDMELSVIDALAHLAANLRQTHPGLHVDTESVLGPADLVLLRTADQAGTLVLGTRGSGGFELLMLGSVAQSVAARAESPVVLVAQRAAAATPGHRVVVGVDPGADCAPVLDFALQQAQEHGVVARAVHVWQPPPLWAAGPIQPGEAERREVQRHEEHLLRETVAAAHRRYPTVEVVSAELLGGPAESLVQESEKASLLVVGRRRHRPVSALGPVAHAVVHYAHCPIAVVPHW